MPLKGGDRIPCERVVGVVPLLCSGAVGQGRPQDPHTQPLPLSQDCQISGMGGTATPWDLEGCQALTGITEKGEAVEQSPPWPPKPDLSIH